MKKRIPALSLLLALLLTVSAAAVGGTGNFVRTRHYGGQFSDLPAIPWRTVAARTLPAILPTIWWSIP